MHELVRIYKNSNGDELRVDTLFMRRKQDVISYPASEHTFQRELTFQNIYFPLSTGITREIATIEVIGNQNSTETITGNYLWAQWDSPSARMNMSDLPQVGDTLS